jgi:hypothetical protein
MRCADRRNRLAGGEAVYLEGEVHRLRREYAAAEDAYRDAGRAGREPQPGLALLRLARGDTRAAVAAIRRALCETADAPQRARLLPACVEIMLAARDVDAARAACSGYSVRFESHTAGGDLARLFRGLPDDRCQLPR